MEKEGGGRRADCECIVVTEFSITYVLYVNTNVRILL